MSRLESEIEKESNLVATTGSSFWGSKKRKKTFLKSLDNQDDSTQVGFDAIIPQVVSLQELSLGKACSLYNANISKCSKLSPSLLEKFEQLYKYAYRLNRYKITPRWIDRFGVLFIADAHVLGFIKNNGVVARQLISATTILTRPVTKEVIVDLGYRLMWILYHLLLMYNDGKDRLLSMDKMANKLHRLGAIDKLTYEFLILCHEGFDYAVNRFSTSRKIVKYSNGFVLSLRNDYDVNLLRLLWLNTLQNILKVYISVQEPYLLKFHNLWVSANLDLIRNSKQFFTL